VWSIHDDHLCAVSDSTTATNRQIEHNMLSRTSTDRSSSKSIFQSSLVGF
jgi:hypothetical protein